MRVHLARDLEKLKEEILTMGGMVEEATSKAIDALVNRRLDLAEEVARSDDKIDTKELEVEEACLKTLALYQPVAGDLRYIVSILKVNNDLERMGDLAIHIAERARFLAGEPPIGMPEKFDEMVDLVQSMVKQSLDSLVRKDAELAKRVIITDDRVDDIYWNIYRGLLERMRNEIDIMDRAFATISACRHLERIGDLATNIAEDVYFIVRGEVIRHRLETGSREDN